MPSVHSHSWPWFITAAILGVTLYTCAASTAAGILQVPTQEFFANSFNIPLTMNPNFETLECEMLIGVEPPPIEEDAVYGVLQHAGLHSR
jgi:Beta-carotene isomerase D27-like, C-terminal